MKLSEAIRLGSLVTRQGRGMASLWSSDAPCALGAALHAIGRQPRTMFEPGYHEIQRVWPWMTYEYQYACPSCVHTGWAGEVIWHLNDCHRWTREHIADWVATIEPQEEANVLETPVFIKEGART